MARRTVRTVAVTICALLVLAAPAAAQSSGSGTMQLNVKEVPVQEVLKLIAESGDLNLAIGDGVKGRVTLFIDEMDPRDVLDVVVGIINAAYVEENGVLWVMSKANYESIYGQKFVDNLESRTFVLKQAKVKEVMPSIKALLGDKAIVVPDLGRNMVRIKASPKLMREVSQMMAAIDRPLITRAFKLRNIDAALAAGLLGKMVTDQTSIVEDEVNGRLIVSSSEFELNKVAEILQVLDVGSGLESMVLEVKFADTDSLARMLGEQLTPEIGVIHADARSGKIHVTDFGIVLDQVSQLAGEFDVPVRQVLVEAKIIQVQTSNKVQTGIDWTVLQNDINLAGTFPAIPDIGPGFRGDLGNLESKDFQVVVQALETYGKTDLLSSPRLMVADGGTGLIHVGSQVPYTTTDTRETTGGTINQFQTVVIVDVGIKLEVTASILGDGMIAMKVRPEVSAVVGYSEDGIPIVDATTLDSSLMVQDGNTVILGGLIKDEVRQVSKGVPVLRSIPIIKYLFSSTEDEKIKGELVILLTPKILTGRETYDEVNGY